jgi:hypothetical protein
VANNPFFADATVIADVAAITALLNSGTLSMYTGSQPTDANTAISGQTKLCTLTFGSTAFGTPAASGSAGSKVVTATANAITSDTNAANTGTATWFRCFASNGTTVVFDGSVGTSGCDINLNTASIVAAATVALTSFTITQTE